MYVFRLWVDDELRLICARTMDDVYTTARLESKLSVIGMQYYYRVPIERLS